MRTLLYTLIIGLLTFGCSKSEPTIPNTNIRFIVDTDTSLVFSSTGGIKKIPFTVNAQWKASIQSDGSGNWCNITTSYNNDDVACLLLTISENTSSDNRIAKILINAGDITRTIRIEQKRKDAFIVTASSYNIPVEGDQIEIAAKTNTHISYSISYDANKWINAVDTKTLNDTTLLFYIHPNQSWNSRLGRIYLTCDNQQDTVTIFQDGNKPSILLSQKKFEISAEGEKININLKSNVNTSWRFCFPDGETPWIIEDNNNVKSDDVYCFSILPNSSYDSRKAEIIFFNTENNISDTVHISQTQLNAIIVDDNYYDFGETGGNLDLSIMTNIDITVTIPENCSSWITQINNTRALDSKKLYFNIAASNNETREGTILLQGGDLSQTIYIKQYNSKEEKERNALIDLYNATDGNNWINNKNWCSHKPVSEWYGITTDESNTVKWIHLPSNNLKGNIPESISNFTELTGLVLYDNQLSGSIPSNIGALYNLIRLDLSHNQLIGSIPESIGTLINIVELSISSNTLSNTIPESIGNLINLEYLSLSYNQLNGAIPESIGSLTKLGQLYITNNKLNGSIPRSIGNLTNLRWMEIGANQLSGSIPETIGNLIRLEGINLSVNQLSGPIPESMSLLTNLKTVYLRYNNLEGTIPNSILNTKWWSTEWMNILPANNYNEAILPIAATKFGEVNTISGEKISDDIYSKNILTICYLWDNCWECQQSIPELKDTYNKYKSTGLGILSYMPDQYYTRDDILLTIKNFQIEEWNTFIYADNPNNILMQGGYYHPTVYIVDKSGNVVYIEGINSCSYTEFIDNYFKNL